MKRKRKILFDELLIKYYTDGTIEVDGLNTLYNKKQQAEIMRALKQISTKTINKHVKKERTV